MSCSARKAVHSFHNENQELHKSGSDCILFGTLQMAWPEVIGRSVNTIRKADNLTEEDRRAILWENAVGLLGVEETMPESMILK